MLTMSEPKITELKHRLPAAARRTQLLDVALDRFGAAGYHETSMEEIAEAAGVTKPVLYQHFSSKRKLYLELLERVGQELVALVVAGAAAEEGPYQRLLGGFRAYIDFVCERANAFQLVFGTGARRMEEFTDTVRQVEDTLASNIAGFIDAHIDDEHREMLGYAIVGLGEVAGRRWVALHPDACGAGLDPEQAELMAVRLADLVWAGLRGLPRNAKNQATGS
jgi:AcrR family transcriptional regulator